MSESGPEQGSELSREDIWDFTLSWLLLIKILASDLVSYFLRPMRLEGIFSTELQSLARMSIEVMNKRKFTDAQLMLVIPHAFLKRVAADMGSDIASALDRWGRRAAPKHEVDVLVRQWHDFLRDLVEGWDENEANSCLPLDTPQESELRLLVREYVSHYPHMDTELFRVWWQINNSPWERGENAAGPWTLLSTFEQLDGREFWESFAKRLSNDQMERLLKWTEETYPNRIYDSYEKDRVWRIPFLDHME